MGSLVDIARAFFRGLSYSYSQFEAAGLGWLPWAILFTFAVAFGIWRVRRHMQRAQVGGKAGQDYSGATLLRSAYDVQHRPSLSPFYGRPVALRAMPYPTAAALLWLWVEARWAAVALAAGGSVYAGRAGSDWVGTRQHRRRIVVPMTKALGPAIGEQPERILEGIVIPKDYQDPAAELVIPLPDDWRPQHVTEASRIVHERLLGEWRHSRNDGSPYFLRFTHKPAPPSFVAFEDVAEYMLHGHGDARGLWQPFLGLGTEGENGPEVVTLNFDGHVVHLGISAGTGAGKSTLMRILATQFAIRSNGTARMAYIDVKGDDEGMAAIPGMQVYNNIGDIDNLDGIYKMWDVIEWYKRELDARRKGERGPKEGWEPLVLFNDEQNAFGKFSRQAWEAIRDKSDPKIPPVWQSMYLLGVMGRSFKIRMVNAYQVMSAQATGGGNAQDGAELRRQFGNKLLARFDPSMWDSLVGTRPRGQSSDIPGRWLHVNNAGLARAVQLPIFEPQNVAELCSAAGLDLPGLPSPEPVPDAIGPASHETTRALGDTGTGDRPGQQDGPSTFPSTELASSPGPYQIRAETSERNPAPEPTPERYTLDEAVSQGIIPVTIHKAKKDRTRARDRDEWYPEPEMRGRAETYTAADLVRFYGDPADGTPETNTQEKGR